MKRSAFTTVEKDVVNNDVTYITLSTTFEVPTLQDLAFDRLPDKRCVKRVKTRK